MPPLHKDLGKSADELLNKSFPTKFELEVTAPSPVEAVQFKITASRDDKGVAAALKETIAFKELGLELDATVQSSKELSVEARKKVIDGVKVILKASTPQFDSRDRLSVSSEVQYQHPLAAVTLYTDLLSSKDILGKLSAVYAATPQINVGGEISSTLTTRPKVEVATTSIAFASPSSEAPQLIATAFRRVGTSTSYGLSLWRSFAPTRFQLGSQMTYEVAEKSLPNLSFGGSYDLSPSSTLYAKYGTNGRIGLALDLKAADGPVSFKTSLGADISSNDPADNRLGFKFVVKS